MFLCSCVKTCFSIFSGGEREKFIQVPALEKLMAVSLNRSVTLCAICLCSFWIMRE